MPSTLQREREQAGQAFRIELQHQYHRTPRHQQAINDDLACGSCPYDSGVLKLCCAGFLLPQSAADRVPDPLDWKATGIGKVRPGILGADTPGGA